MGVPELNPFAEAVSIGFEANDPGVAGKALEYANVLVVRRLFEDLGRGDLDAFVSGVTDDVELEIYAPAAFSWVRRAKGRQELRDAVEHNFGTLAEQQPEVLKLVAQGHCIVLIGRERGRVRESGLPYDVYFVYEFTLRDGRVQHIREIGARADGQP